MIKVPRNQREAEQFAREYRMANPRPLLQERSFNAFRDRATNMGAKDVIQMLAHIAAGGTLTPIPPPPPMPAAPPAATPIFPTTPPPAPPAAPPPPPAPAAPSITPAEAQAMIDSLPPIPPKA